MKSIPESFARFLAEHVTPRKKTAVLFSQADLFPDFLLIKNIIQSKAGQVSTILLNYYLHPLLKKEKLTFHYIFDYAKESDYLNLKKDSEVQALNWFYTDDDDPTLIDNMSYGLLLEHNVGFFFHKIFKAAQDTLAFFREAQPEAIILLTRQNPPVSDYFYDIENNIYQTLIRYQASKSGIPLYEFKYPRESKSGFFKKIFSRLKPERFSIPGTKIKFRLPRFLIDALKSVYIVLNNLSAKLRQRRQAPGILFASPSTVSYYGKRLTDCLFSRKDYNLTVYNGETPNSRVINYRAHLDPVLGWRKRNFIHKEMRERWKIFFASRHAHENLTYQGIPVLDLFAEVFESLFVDTFADAYVEAQKIRRLLSRKHFKLILLTSDLVLPERTMALIGREMGIPSLNLQHAIEGITQSTPLGFPRRATHKAAWSHKRKDWLIGKGHPPDSIFVVGCPLHSLAPMNSSGHFKLDQPGIILYLTHSASQFFGDRQLSPVESERIMMVLLKTIQRFPQKTLVVKTRPGDEQESLYVQWIKDTQCKAFVTNADLNKWLEKCDIFLTLYSTAGAEAMMYNKPGIVLSFAEKEKTNIIKQNGLHDIPYAEYGAALDLPSEDPDLLAALIEKIYTSPETRDGLAAGRKKFLRDYCGLGHGDPVENFMNLVNDILEKKQPASAPANPPTTC